MPLLSFEFFGVRGSRPVAGPQVAGVGGNTACVLVELDTLPDGSRPGLILDAGTGIVALGERLTAASEPDASNPSLFLSHLHWDHIQGLPFFSPLYASGTTLTVLSAREPEVVREALDMQMRPPFFPVHLTEAGATLRVEQVDSTFTFGDATAKLVPLSHPGGCSGLRINAFGRSLLYASDHEIGADERCDLALREAIAGCSAVILDAQYGPEQRALRSGWGHSSWTAAAEMVREAGGGTLYLFHHGPEHDDMALRDRLVRARRIHPMTELAVEGQRVVL